MTETRCDGCGAEVEISALTCPSCGASLPVSADETAAFSPVAEVEDQEVTEVVAAGRGPALVVKKGPDAGERFALNGPVVSIGRDPGSDIFLNDITVSRRHARIEVEAKSVTLSDVGSLNGTYVNGQRIESVVLAPGDEVQIGKFKLVFTP